MFINVALCLQFPWDIYCQPHFFKGFCEMASAFRKNLDL